MIFFFFFDFNLIKQKNKNTSSRLKFLAVSCKYYIIVYNNFLLIFKDQKYNHFDESKT